MSGLIDHIKGYCTFAYYRDSSLWYKTETNIIFPVPISDVGTATFKDVEKGLLMMRYIRKYLNALESER